MEISYETGCTAGKAFFRLHHTDLTPPPGVSLEDWDADGDGLSNDDEVKIHQTNPLDPDTDGDGLPDGWEVAHGLAPLLDDAGLLFQSGPATNLEAFQAGVQAYPNATMDDFDADGLANDLDAVPDDKLIDWERTGQTRYALIDLGDATEGWSPMALADNAAVLFQEGRWDAGQATAHDFETVAGTFPWEGETISYEAEAGSGFALSPDGGSVLFQAHSNATDGSAFAGGDGWDTALMADATFPWEIGPVSSPAGDFASFHPVGVDATGRAVVVSECIVEQPPESGEYVSVETLEIYSPSGGYLLSVAKPGSFEPVWTPDQLHSGVDPGGRIVCNQADDQSTPGTVAYRLGLWDAQGQSIDLPPEADGWKWPVHLGELPNGELVLAAGNNVSYVSDVFLQGENDAFETSAHFQGSSARIFAGNGTALGSDLRLWANGEWIDTADWCPELRELIDEGWNFDAIDSNGSGAYLVGQYDAAQTTVKSKLLVPVEVLVPKLDSEGNEVQGELVPAQELQIAKMGGGTLIDALDNFLMIGSDVDRFHVAIPGLPVDAEVAILLQTGHPGGDMAEYRDPQTSIPLEYDAERKRHITKSMILVSDHGDDIHVQNLDGEENDMFGDEVLGDRSHIAFPGGIVRVASVTIDGKTSVVNLDLPVEFRKTVTVKIWRIKKKSYNLPYVAEAVVNEHIKVLKERYAQIGLEINVVGPAVKEIPSDVNLDDGYQIQKEGQPGTTEEEDKFLEAVATNTPDDIEIFYVPEIKNIDDPSNESAGYSYSPAGFPASNDIHNNVVIAEIATRYVLAHELGHILLNLVGHTRPGHLMNAKVNTIHDDDFINDKRLGKEDEKNIYKHPQVNDKQ